MELGTYVDGRSLNFDETTKQFDVGGAQVTIADVVGYDQAGQVEWLSDDLKQWARNLAAGQVTEGTPSGSGSLPTEMASPKGLFGFRSKKPWRMAVASIYYAFAALIGVGVMATRKPYATNGADIAVEMLTGLFIAVALLSPAFLLSDFGYRNNLPLFKKRKAAWTVLGLALFFGLMLVTSALAYGLHTQPYKVAAAAERTAQDKEAAKRRAAEEEKKAAEAKQQADADAKKAAEADAKKAAETSAAAEAKRQADAKKAAEASAAAAVAAPTPAPKPVAAPKSESPADYLRKTVTDVMGEKTNMGDKPKIREITDSGGAGSYLITLNGNENLTNDMTKEGMWVDTQDLWERVFTERKDIKELYVRWFMPLTDVKGNTSDGAVMSLAITKENAADVKWDNVLFKNIPVIANDYWESPVFNN